MAAQMPKTTFLSVKSRCFSAVDDETGESYFVSPRSGDLIVLSHEECLQDCVRSALRPLAVDVQAETAPDPLLGLRFTAIEARASDVDACRRFMRSMAKPMQMLTRFMPLDLLARAIARAGTSRAERLSASAAVAALRSLGEPPRNQCLQTSFTQAAFLGRNGVPLRLHVGVWIPTTWMHAWVTVPLEGSGAVGEWLVSDSVDRIAHFQPVLRFDFDQ